MRAVNLQVPLATHAGWNLRAKGFMEDQLCYLNGMHVPFAKTKKNEKRAATRACPSKSATKIKPTTSSASARRKKLGR